jgi:hypothetical protein
MPYTNVAIDGLESYQPAIDYRRSGRVGVIAGANFAWDASGVYSAYANRLVSTNASLGLSPNLVQSLDLETDIHVAVNGKIWKFNPSSAGSPVGTWANIQNLAALVDANIENIPYDFRKWTSAYLGGNRYACAYNYGVYRVTNLTAPTPTYTRLTSGTIPGFPVDATPVIAIAETNGRMVYLTATTVYWSAPNAPENLVPALGGAGFQVLAERIAGTPITITPTSGGAIIWTNTGGLVMEFIGGDLVFRFWQLSTKTLPLSAFAITRMPNDDYAILTRLGLYLFNNLSQPSGITPLFNEFMRENLRNKPTAFGHLWYSITDNRLYVGIHYALAAFTETYALDIAIDRWGVFNETHIGFFEYGTSRNQFAWATTQGVACYLLTALDSRRNREDPLAPGTFIGLASEILIGWIQAENFIPHADTVQELHEIAVNRLTPFGVVLVVIVDEGTVTDPSPTTFDEGLVTALSPTTFDEGTVETANLPVNYQLEVWTDLFLFDLGGTSSTNVFVPELVSQARELDLWVTIAPSNSFRLRFIATAVNEYYRLNSLNLTIAYDGNIS